MVTAKKTQNFDLPIPRFRAPLSSCGICTLDKDSLCENFWRRVHGDSGLQTWRPGRRPWICEAAACPPREPSNHQGSGRLSVGRPEGGAILGGGQATDGVAATTANVSWHLENWECDELVPLHLVNQGCVYGGWVNVRQHLSLNTVTSVDQILGGG